MQNAAEQGPVRHQETSNLMFHSFPTSARCRMIVDELRPSKLQLNKRQTFKVYRAPYECPLIMALYAMPDQPKDTLGPGPGPRSL